MKLNNNSNSSSNTSPMLAIAVGVMASTASTAVSAASVRNTCHIGNPTDFGQQLTSFHDPAGVCSINPQLRATISNSFGTKHLNDDGFNVAWATSPQALMQLLTVSAKEVWSSKGTYGPFVAAYQTVVGFPMDAPGQAPLCPSEGNYTLSVYEPNYKSAKAVIPTYTSLYTWFTQNVDGLESLDSGPFYELHEQYMKTYAASTMSMMEGQEPPPPPFDSNKINPIETLKEICGFKGAAHNTVAEFDPSKDCENKDFLQGLNAVCNGYGDNCDAGKELQTYLSEQTQKGTLTAAGLRGALLNGMDFGALNSGVGLGFNKAPFDVVNLEIKLQDFGKESLNQAQYYYPEVLFLENLPNDPDMTSGKYLSFKNFEFTCDDACVCEMLTQ